MSKYISYKLQVLRELKINISKYDITRLQACKSEIQADAISRTIILNALEEV